MRALPGRSFHWLCRYCQTSSGWLWHWSLWVRGHCNFPNTDYRAALNITSGEATLSGSLTTLGSATSVIVSFQWGTDTSYADGDIVANPSSITSVPTAFSASLSGLTANTTYHFRAEAVGATTVYGGDQQFTTSPVDLVVTSSSLPNAIVGEAYSQSLSASVVAHPYTWKIVSGVLPNGYRSIPVELFQEPQRRPAARPPSLFR